MEIYLSRAGNKRTPFPCLFPRLPLPPSFPIPRSLALLSIFFFFFLAPLKGFKLSVWIREMRSSSQVCVFNEKELFQSSPPPSTVDEYVEEMLPLYEEYYDVEELSLSVTTYNVGCKKPVNISTSLMALFNAATKKSTDIISVAFQEVDMSATALLREETEAAGPWITACNKMLNVAESRSAASPTSYFALPPKQLVGLLLCVYIRSALQPFLREFQLAVVPTGALGSVGNKGAVGVRLVIDNNSICFLSAHLPSGQSDVRKRNASAETILTTMDFNAIQRAEYEHGRKSNSPEEALNLFPPIRLRDQDIAVVAGDLNYRADITYDVALQLIALKQYSKILQSDQFEAEVKNIHTPWYDFTSLGPIAHPPTYRFDFETNNYDTSDKRRIPGYTDRILIYVKDPNLRHLVKVDSLEAIMDIKVSDHKPVLSSLRVPVRWVDPSLRSKIEKQLITHYKQVSSSDALYHTETTISTSCLEFGDLYSYMEGSSQIIEIKNTGNIVASVRVVRLNAANDVTLASWIRVTPSSLVILPGQSKKITIRTSIDSSSGVWLSEWKPFSGVPMKSLTSTLKVVVRSSNCHLVTCKANLFPSIVRNFLDSIFTLGPTPLCKAYQLENFSTACCSKGIISQVPKELWIIGEILSHHPHQRGLFTTTVDANMAATVFRRLDTSPCSLLEDTQFTKDPKVVVAVGYCLATFLEQLIIPVIPYERYSDVLNVMSGKAISGGGGPFAASPLGIVENLSEFHANTFIYVLSLFQFLLRPENATYNRLSSDTIVEVFSSILLRPPLRGEAVQPYFRDNIPPNAMLPPEELLPKPVCQKERERMEEEHNLAKQFLQFFLVRPSPTI